MNRGQETHPIRVTTRYEMNWANSFLKKFRKPCLQTDGRMDRRTDRHRGESSIPPFHLQWYNDILLIKIQVLDLTRQIWGIWKLRPAYSPETPNLGHKLWCFVPCDLEIWWMTLENNRASLLCCFKLCAIFHSHWWIQTGVTVRKRPIWVKFNSIQFFFNFKKLYCRKCTYMS